MGIRYLNTYMKNKCKTGIKTMQLKQLSCCSLAVDISIYMYRYEMEDKLIENTITLINTLLSYDINPIFVFDGKPPEEKGLLGKLKDAAEDQEHQIQILGTFVRLGVVVWSGFIITMNYVELPMVKKSGNSDITFVASVFTGALATFGLTTGNKSGNSKPTPVNCPMVKKKEE